MIFELDLDMRTMAERLISAYPQEFGHIEFDRVLFYQEITGEPDKGGSAARCRKIQPIFRQALADAGVEADWIIEFYSAATADKGERWLAILMFHELRHIGFDGKLVKHDLEDFIQVLQLAGILWYTTEEKDLPDIITEKLLAV